MKYIIALICFSVLCYTIPSNTFANSKIAQKTVFECSILSGLKVPSGDSEWWGKWREVLKGVGHYNYSALNIKDMEGTYEPPVFECTAKNGSIRIQSYAFIEKSTGQLINTTINNQRKVFVGTTDQIMDRVEITIMVCNSEGCR